MISAGIKTTHVKIPMVVGYHQDIRLDVIALSAQQAAQQVFVGGDAWLVYQPADSMTSKLFMQTDETVGVSGQVQRMEPFQLGVPTAEPCFATLALGLCWYLQLWVLENLQRQSGFPW